MAQLMETAYIGKLGALELASAGIGVAIFNILSKIFNIPLLSIATSFVAEDISKNATKHSTSGKLELPSVSSALVLAAAIGTIEALALFLGSGLFLKLMGVSPNSEFHFCLLAESLSLLLTQASPMYASARLFLSLRALGAPANVIMLAVQGIFRGFKDTKTPVLFIGLGNLSAVALLPLLIYGFKLGITGAAISTVASQYIIAILLMWSLSKRAVLLPPKMDQLEFGGYLKSGGMLLGRTLSILLTMTIGTSMAARQGPTAMAAHQICLQVWLAVSLLADALAVSAQALIASSYAILDYKRVQKVAMYSLQIGLASGLALAVGLYISFGSIAKLFTNDPQVLAVVSSCALFVCASQPVNALAFIFDGLHYGVSDFDYVAQATIVVGVISSLVLLYAPRVFGLAGVWAGLTTLMGLRMAAGILSKVKFSVDVSKSVAYRARRKAIKVVQGDQKEQYYRLRDYLQAVLDTNPGSRCVVTTFEDPENPAPTPRFKYMFYCLHASKQGFLNGCRPFIGLDGCFIKLTTGQQILAATGRDGNNNIYPIAFGVVDKEDSESWTWFLTQLRCCIGSGSKFGTYTIISDRQKGLLKAINEVFPDSPQRYCLRHIYANFQSAGFRGAELKKLVDIVCSACAAAAIVVDEVVVLSDDELEVQLLAPVLDAVEGDRNLPIHVDALPEVDLPDGVVVKQEQDGGEEDVVEPAPGKKKRAAVTAVRRSQRLKMLKKEE
ncbi:MATE efflux family protein 3, chloroplastic [Triticum urartu]|uniref:Protein DETOXIFICATION n=1 Tax=Triticum urartu TaxID=4572 RepID=M7YF46_TRIUA|nr:MATE efflux family protein 3, chloroplastic [Triticum urartu]